MRTYPNIDIVKLARNKIELPSIVTDANKYAMGMFLFLFAFFTYISTNHFHLFTPRTLPLSWVDELVPLVPNTVWLYISEYFLFIVVYIFCRSPLNLNRYFYSFFVVYFLSTIIFIVWPTTYPRHLFPLPTNINEITYYVFNMLRNADTPANCCPSLHVSSVYLASFVYLDEDKRKFPFFFTWATVVAVSTLTTKQHYLFDIILGFLMAAVTYWFFSRCANYTSPAAVAAKVRARTRTRARTAD